MRPQKAWVLSDRVFHRMLWPLLAVAIFLHLIGQ